MDAQIVGSYHGYLGLIAAAVRQAEKDLRYSGPPRYGMPAATDKLTAGVFLAYMRGDDTPWPGVGIDGETTTTHPPAKNRAC